MIPYQTPRIVLFYRWLWKYWKTKPFRRFITALQPTSNCVLLDIGGYPADWFGHHDAIGKVDVLNLECSAIDGFALGAPEIRTLAGDARNLSFPDQSYDIAFSNSVIEHVGTLEDQQNFASEARRVGKKLWIQTPARGCPIEPHYLGIFIHWFPRSWHVTLARWSSLRGLTGAASLEELRAIAATTRLLSKAEFSAMFPDCEIWTERLLFVFPKSYVAIRR